jgi:hypothetical protein
MLGYNLGKILKKYFISFYNNKKLEYICENNVVYMCIQKHKYIQ